MPGTNRVWYFGALPEKYHTTCPMIAFKKENFLEVNKTIPQLPVRVQKYQ